VTTSFTAYEYTQLQWKLQYKTDILKPWNGKETGRVMSLTYPREWYDISYESLDESDLRDLRRLLYLSPIDDYSLHLEHEGMVVQTNISGTTVIIDSTYSDWVANTQKVLVRNVRGQQYEATISNVNSGHPGTACNLTLSASPPGGQTYEALTSRLFPVVSLDLADSSPMNRYQVNQGKLRLTGEDRIEHVTWGTGGPSLASYGGFNLLDRKPYLPDTYEEDIAAGFDRLDLGFQATSEWSRTVGDIMRYHDYYVGPANLSERQWWRKFLDAIKGRQAAFLCPTWRDDLPVSVAPTPGSNTIIITNPPNYSAWWTTSSAQDRILYITDESAGTWTPMTISNVVSSGGGTTWTLTTVEVVPAGTLQKISFLETCRLESDEIVFAVQGMSMRSKISMRVVQQ
jgi:hypothetical protein